MPDFSARWPLQPANQENSPLKRWQIAERLPVAVETALSDYPPVLRQILFNRGYCTAAEARLFLMAEAPENSDPFNILGVHEAVKRIETAVQNQEQIAIYGDYDADGVTATALLVGFLSGAGAQVRGYIPNRFDEGYGLNNEALKTLASDGIKLIITVDCGIRSPEEARYARQLGLDLIISDHHHPGGEIPEALAVINPRQPGDTYPEKNLAGVGLAYKLASAIEQNLLAQGDHLPPEHQAANQLDLVALGTIADMVPLNGENRWLVRQGLDRIRKPRRQGLLSLMGAAGINPNNITAMDIGFALGPRLNAAGRLDTALTAFRLLTTQNVSEASELAQRLELQNRDRQEITRSIQAKAEQIALAGTSPGYLLFAADPEFNAGVVGLVASRLTESYYRPCIVAQQGPEFTRGSCRSIPEFHITEALDLCADLLAHHGGHAAAAGFTVANESLPELISRLRAIAEQQLADKDLRPILRADLELELRNLKPEILEYLEWLQPTGQSNPQAVFVSRELKVVRSRTVGRDASHLKLTVTDGYVTYDAIAFRMGEWHTKMPEKIDLLYTFETNEFNGRQYLQLNVRDLRPSGIE